jgi:hypothetical protein
MALIDPLLGAAPTSLVARSTGALADPLTGTPVVSTSSGTAAPTSAGSAGVAPKAVPASGVAAPSALAGTTAAVAAPAAAAPAAPAAAAAPGGPAVVPPPQSLRPATRAAGTVLPANPAAYERFESQFRIRLDDVNHLLKLVNPARYGKVFATDVFGKSYEISGTRALNSFGNNLSNAGADGRYGTADDIRPGNPAYVRNSQGLGAEFWANAETPFTRLTRPEWGTLNGVEQVGRPRGYTGGIDVNANRTLVEPVNQALANSRLVSNAVGAQAAPVLNDGGWNVANMSFGQYFDHGLDFLERSGVRQSIASATAPGDPLHPVSGGAVGVVGDRGGQFVMDPVSRSLVQVAFFNAGSHGAAGLYSFSLNGTVAVPQRSAAAILGRAVLDTDLLARNKTEALIQNSQAYGSGNAHAYLLRESARFNAAGVYTDQAGVVYRIGGTVNGRRVSGVANGLVRLVDASAPGGFILVKTAKLLSSRLLTGDGLPSIPTYAEILLNNGVDPARIQAILSANGGNGVALGSPAWVALTQDPRFVTTGNVLDFDPSSPTYRQLVGAPLIGDTAVAINARAGAITGPADPNFGALAAIDQNLDGIPDALRGQSAAAVAPFFPGRVITAQQLAAQPLIRAEDWGAGQLLFHTVTGDWRSNENIGLSTFHTLWTREHNFQVDNLRNAIATFKLSGVSEDDLHSMARVIIEGEYQKMIYEEFAPSIAGDVLDLGSGKHGFAGYNPTVDAGISLEFAVASYRVGHSQIPQDLLPGVDMFSAFLNPQLFFGYGNSAIQAGLLQRSHEAIDTLMTNGVRNNLVTRNLDLFTANVLRGRELGLPSFNAMRRELFTSGPLLKANGTDFTARFQGNPLFRPYASWEEFGSRMRDWVPAKDASGTNRAFNQADRSSWGSSALLTKFRSVYASLEDVDAWVGMLAEKPSSDTGQMGPLMAYVFLEQLDRLQEGDRFYYIPRLKGDSSNLWNELDTLHDIVVRTSDSRLAAPNGDVFKTQASNDILATRPDFVAANLAVGDQFRTGVTSLFAAADPWANLVAATL